MKTCAEIFIHINNPIEYAKRITGDSLDAFVSALHFVSFYSFFSLFRDNKTVKGGLGGLLYSI